MGSAREWPSTCRDSRSVVVGSGEVCSTAPIAGGLTADRLQDGGSEMDRVEWGSPAFEAKDGSVFLGCWRGMMSKAAVLAPPVAD